MYGSCFMVVNKGLSRKLVAFSIVSPLHLINFMAFYITRSEEYDEVVVGLASYWDKSVIPERYLEYCKAKGVKFVSSTQAYSFVKDQKVIYDFVFINDYALKLLLKGLFKVSVGGIYFIDEGISTYGSTQYRLKAILRETGWLTLFKYFFKKILILPLTVFFYNRTMFFNAFDRKTLLVNEKFRRAFIAVLNELNFGIINSEKTLIVFCGQPWVELGLKSEQEYKTELLTLKRKIEDLGYDFKVKKHPAEFKFNYEHYSVDIICFEGIIEEYVFKSEVKAIISKNSTSSILCSAMFGVESYIIDYNNINTMGSRLEKLFTTYSNPLKSLK